MPTTLSYGQATTCLLEDSEAAHLRSSCAESIAVGELAGHVRKQLADPIDFPQLSQATIPGDVVAIVVETGLPQPVQILDGVLRSLAEIQPESITILLNDSGAIADELASELAKLGHEQVQVKCHEPDNEKEIAFLGVTRDDLAIRLNRLLCDADFVLPIGVAHGQVTTDISRASLTGLFPEFSDRETIDRVATLGAESFPELNAEVAAEIEECSRQLGAQLVLQVVPGLDGQVARVIAGETRSACQHAAEVYRENWLSETHQRADLVIATLTGDQTQQTWHNLGRAIAAAQVLLEPEGALVICTELDEQPGPAMGQLAGNDDSQLVEREILRHPSGDAGPAMLLNQVLQHETIYLRSRLRDSVVESLGMSPLATDGELERLVQSHASCIVVEDAQRMLIKVVESTEGSDE